MFIFSHFYVQLFVRHNSFGYNLMCSLLAFVTETESYVIADYFTKAK